MCTDGNLCIFVQKPKPCKAFAAVSLHDAAVKKVRLSSDTSRHQHTPYTHKTQHAVKMEFFASDKPQT